MSSSSDPIATEAEKLDREIGARVRRARKARGMTQTELGEALGVSFQQVQKYERGTNRISSSALILMSRVLECSPQELLGVAEDSSSGLDWSACTVEVLDLAHRITALSPGLNKIVAGLVHELEQIGKQ